MPKHPGRLLKNKHPCFNNLSPLYWQNLLHMGSLALQSMQKRTWEREPLELSDFVAENKGLTEFYAHPRPECCQSSQLTPRQVCPRGCCGQWDAGGKRMDPILWGLCPCAAGRPAAQPLQGCLSLLPNLESLMGFLVNFNCLSLFSEHTTFHSVHSC